MTLGKDCSIDGSCPTNELVDRAQLLCSSRSQRLTPIRRKIFSIIADSQGPIKAYRILDLLQEDGFVASPPTVYRTLDFLLVQQLVHRVQSLNAFVACQHPERHHTCQLLICTTCGTSSELEAGNAMSSVATKAARVGFTINETILEFKGICALCKNALMSFAASVKGSVSG